MDICGNNSKLQVKGIHTCKVNMCGDCSLMLQDILYALYIRRNLAFVSVSLDVVLIYSLVVMVLEWVLMMCYVVTVRVISQPTMVIVHTPL